MAFTDDEKARIKRQLGYPNWVALSQAIQLGFPAASQPAFLLDDAFKRFGPESEALIRRDLCECEAIECQLSDARSRFKTTAIGEVHINEAEPRLLRTELEYWRKQLSNDLGVVIDPFAYDTTSAGGINARVM